MLDEKLFPHSIGQADETLTGITIPVIEEKVSIEKKIIETGIVKVVKEVQQKEETINIDLISEEYFVEHIAKDEFVDDNIPATRQEGDVLIIPVLKEVMVKRVLLTEEIRVTKKIAQQSEPQNVTLRKETVTIKHLSVNNKDVK